ncbi:MAG: molybdopterin/thiamine biosynthesis adenylyltransferase [Halioglobus sp.]|jgi:molybdopterin/thiamine biosynthesis adenylyltransferase
MSFDYHEAFSRNLGWVTKAEQEVLRNKRIAIAGMGGVGGSHLLTLSRLGIGAFSLADFDQFELANFNRQAGASMPHLGRDKLEVMSELALAINPEQDLKRYPAGVNLENLDDFLDGVDLYVDSLDFFALQIRREVFAACHKKGIPAITAAPLGMGSALLCFLPGQMSFEDYFLMEGQPEEEQALRFMLGLAPSPQHMAYLVDDSRIDLKARKGPSTPMACELCAGFAGTYALKILLGRGDVPAAPRGIHFDAYRNKLATTWRPGGNANPLQRFNLMMARKRLGKNSGEQVETVVRERPIERILDLARWAPSGDNDQPWKFEITGDHTVTIHGNDTRDWCVYDLDGTSSQIAIGALLETLTIAASGEGMRAESALQPDSPETHPVIDVTLTPDGAIPRDPLLSFIEARVTQRKPFTKRAMSEAQKRMLEQAVGESFRVIWIEGESGLRQMAKLLFHNAHIRLTTPEAYEVHRRNIEWGVQFSEDRMPEGALGLDVPTRKIMRWALQSWRRVKFLNRFFAGTWLPRIQMDLLTSLGCAAHFVIVADKPLATVQDYLDGGRAVQRFWLEVTKQGMQFQPEMTPVIFSRYVAQGLTFTSVASEQALASRLASELSGFLTGGEDPMQRVYMGRIGFGDAPQSRSTRPPLETLLVDDQG